MGIQLVLYLCFLVSHAYAGLITIPLNDKEFKLAPASDLIYQGARITEVEAMELAKKGVDLSELDPYTSDLFRSQMAPGEARPQIKNEVVFHSFLQSPTEFFRFVSKSENQSYTVTASLFNHETMLRAHLLKKIGYGVPEIIQQPELKVYFETHASMDLFLQKLVESTLLAKKRWVIEDNRYERYLKIKGLILEPSDTKSVPVYWPIMEETRQRKRRVYRSLLYLYTLTDFNMPINEISWSLGKIFNSQLILSHQFSDAFSSVTESDLKWVHRRIISVPEHELCLGLDDANYPADVAQLLCEKLKSRINSFGKLLGLAAPLKINERIDVGQVRRGKLTSGNYPGHVPVFWIEDAESPYRFSEVFKFFRTQVAYDTIANLLNRAEKDFLPGISTGEAFENIIEKVRKFGSQNGYVPLRVWSNPIASGSVGGSRSIVFGKYDGNDAPIQLVDTLNMKIQVGVFNFLSVPGSSVIPTATLNAQLVRSWSHIKAMPDLSTATKQQIDKLLIPRLYHSLGNLLESEPQCSLQNEAWVSEEIVAGVGVWIVYYDQASDTAKEVAIKLREELIASGTPKNKILLRPVIKDELCLKEVTEKRNKSIEEFLKSFALNETLTVTDSLETTAGIGVKLNDSIIDKLNLQAGLEGKRAILRSYIIRKTETGIEITIRNQKDLSTRFYQELNFFTDLLSNSTNWVKGDLHSKVYRVNFEGADEEQRKIGIEVLREVFLRNSYGLLKEHYNPVVMDHDARVKLNTFKFFWRKSERLRMNHEVSVTVPNRETQREIPQEEILDEWTIPTQPPVELTEAERTRQLFSTMVLMRRGNNYHSFIDQILNDQFSWLSTGAQDGDPGQSVKGNSFHSYFVTEGDLSPGFEFNPVTKVEYGNLGWSLSKKKLERLLRIHEDYLSTEDNEFTLDRSIFNQTSSLRSYNIRTTILLYPQGTQKLMNALFVANEVESIKLLKLLYGVKKWDNYCRRPPMGSTREDSYLYESSRERGLFYCIPEALMGIMRMRQRGLATRRQNLGIQINTVVQILMGNVPKKNLLTWIGKENFFGNTFVSGFRNGDSTGYTQYASNTVGTYNQDLATGIFDQIAGVLGVRAYDLKGMVYTPNM